MNTGTLPILPAIVGAALLAGSGVALSAVIRTRGFHLQKLEINAADNRQMHTLPETYPTWSMIGRGAEMSAEAIAELGTSNFLTASFERTDVPEGEPRPRIELHVAYYTGMIDTVPHVPERCLVAAGLQQAGTAVLVPVPLDFARLTTNSEADPTVHGGTVWGGRSPNTFRRVNLPAGLEKLEMRVTPFRDDRGRMLFSGYFFVTNGTTVPSADDIRLRAFRLSDDYAYYTKVQFTSVMVDSPEELGREAGKLLDEIFPDLMYRMPDWVEVKAGRYPPKDAPGPG
jgi:hypothetical protein